MASLSDTQPVNVTLFKANQIVMTPMGRGTFISYVDGTRTCRVKMLVSDNGKAVPHYEIFSSDEIVRSFEWMQPVITPDGHGLFIAALTDGHRCQVAIHDRGVQRNPIYRLDEIQPATGQKSARHTAPEPATVLQVQSDDLVPV